MKSSLGLTAFASLTVLGSAFVMEGEARACGGCFHPPTQVASDITDEKMLLSVSPGQTTLYDQIEYSGSPSSFAWVLPIHGTVDVGLSADVLFQSVDALTATSINPPPSDCPSPPNSCLTPSYSGGAENAATSADGGVAGVTVTKAQTVGPYETVQLHATDSSALNDWLSTNGFVIPADVTPIIDAYVAEGFDFLAMKLLPDEGIQAMRPVRVTIPGMSLSLPLRMAAIGTGSTVGITLWVVSEGRYEPQNFPYYHIEDSQLVWDDNLGSSNYTTLRAQNEAALGGKGWEIESSIDVNEQQLTSVILGGGQYYGYGYQPPPTDASQDYLPVTVSAPDGGAAADAGTSDAGTSESAEQVRDDDINTLFAGLSGTTVRITRIRSDIAHAAMNQDFILAASADQSELSNIRTVTKQINETCSIYSSCEVTGTGTPAESQASVDEANDSAGGGCRTAPTKRPESPTTALAFAAIGAFVLLGMRTRKG
jgi:hypothetical protein